MTKSLTSFSWPGSMSVVFKTRQFNNSNIFSFACYNHFYLHLFLIEIGHIHECQKVVPLAYHQPHLDCECFVCEVSLGCCTDGKVNRIDWLSGNIVAFRLGKAFEMWARRSRTVATIQLAFYFIQSFLG